MPESGFKINGKFYAIPQSLRVGETRMIKRITGLNPPEFMKALNEFDETQDPDVGAAMVWWVVHREDPTFTIDQIDDLEWGEIDSESGDEAEVVDPKDDGARSASSPISADASNSSPGVPGEMTPANGGDPDLAHFGHPT